MRLCHVGKKEHWGEGGEVVKKEYAKVHGFLYIPSWLVL
jgi:hypothetical protein